jgi:hypothetical protein
VKGEELKSEVNSVVGELCLGRGEGGGVGRYEEYLGVGFWKGGWCLLMESGYDFD